MLVYFILGGPGSGKGTQCKRLAERFPCKHINVGELLRAERDNPIIRECMRDGRLVPTNFTIELVQREIRNSCAEIILLDGFPRSFENLKAWNEQCSYEYCCISLQCEDTELVRRLSSRGRSDDQPDVIHKRIEGFHTNTEPVIDHFREKNRLIEIDASQNEDDVFLSISKIVCKKRIFFPGSGFGFWFLLPRLFQVANSGAHICGASAGSLMCAIALLDPSYHTYEAIRDIALETVSELSFPLNLYDLNKRFVKKILAKASREKLGQISIQLTKFRSNLSLEKVIIYPKTFEELEEAILISTYIPFLSRNEGGDVLFKRNGERFADGMIYNLCCGNDVDVVPDNRYAGIPFYIPSEEHCHNMFKEGEDFFANNIAT